MAVMFLVTLIVAAYSQSVKQGSALLLTECGEYPYATWKVNHNPDELYTTFSLLNYPGSCIDCNYCQAGKTPYAWDCSPSQKNQWWNVENITSNNILLQSTVNGSTCIGVVNDVYTTMQLCNSSDIQQTFILNSPKPGYIASAYNSSLCLTIADFNCTIAPFDTYPYCNQQLPSDQRVDDLVSRMTLYEKTVNLQNQNPGIPRLGVPKNGFGESLHGVLGGCTDAGKCPTSFPHALLLGATFNRSLWRAVGSAISTEVRAFTNIGQGSVGLFRWAPDINLFRDPRWGRGQEVPGEDPFLTGQYAMEWIDAYQYGEDERYLKVVATAKHFADYDQEGNFGTDRGAFDANVSMQDQVDYYWPAWRAAIQSGKVQSIMCSYNAVNNIPSCGNDYFMNQIAREEWGFDGFIVSDCGAISDPASTRYIQQTYPMDNVTTQNYLQANQAMSSGCDTNCGSFYDEYLQLSIENGYTKESDVDKARKRLWKRTIDLGKLDYNPPSYYTNIDAFGPNQIDSAEHRQLALNAAEQGIVLLKSEGQILPVSIDGISSIAMIGPHANATQVMLSNYHGTNTLVNSNSPYDAFKAYANKLNSNATVTYNQGCDYMCNDTSGFAQAIEAAKKADVAVVFFGLHPDPCPSEPGSGAVCESEGRDRNTIEFAGHQLDLLKQVYEVNKNTILVLINGGGIDISWAKENIDGIIEAFYPGELGGVAIANVVFGLTAPAGKLPYTLYDASFLSARPSIMDMSLRDNGGITYRYYTGKPVYPFGYGLYYTQFSYKYYNNSDNGHRVIETKLLADFYRNGYYFYRSDATSFVIEVTNEGNRNSDCVVLGFVTSENDPDAPLIKLFDFQRVYVEKGKSVNVTLSITPESISITNKYGNERIVPGDYNLCIGDHQNGNYAKVKLTMTGKEESIFNLEDVNRRYNARKK